MFQRFGTHCQQPPLVHQQHPSLHQRQYKVALGAPLHLGNPQEMHSKLKPQQGSSLPRGKPRLLPRQPKPHQQRQRLKTRSLQPSRLKCPRLVLYLSQVPIFQALGASHLPDDIFGQPPSFRPELAGPQAA